MITIFLSLFILLTKVSHAYLVPRESTPTCTDLRANSNNGDRKIAIVIDSSGSMSYSDPYGYRLVAGKMVVDWLISKKEATATQKEDKVAIINFDDEAFLDYPLGDPGSADSALASIGEDGGTYIAGGVEMAIEQLTAAGTGGTANRSGILVFTDGEDYDTPSLVDQINRASSLGIRVAFGFLDESSSVQDSDVLSAIMNSGGRYFTIQNYNASKAFVDGIIVNGLTTNDNPAGDTTTLLAGLDAAHFISGSETQTMTYGARSKEQLTFNVQSVNAGILDVQIVSGGKTLAKDQSDYYGSGLPVIAPSTGKIDVKVTAHSADKNSIFVVGVVSNLPPENCTVGVVGETPKHNNIPPIAGGGAGGAIALVLFVGIAYLIYKHCCKPPGKGPHHPTDHPSNCGQGPKSFPTSTFQEIPDPDPSYVPWFKFPPHPPPAESLPPKKAGDKLRTWDDDGHDHNEPDRTRKPGQLDQPGNSSQPQNPNEPSQPQNPNQPDQPQNPNQPNQPQNPDQPQNPEQPQNPQNLDDDHYQFHIARVKHYGDNHHHHLPEQHPCYKKKCPIASNSHRCEDPRHPCTCVDPKCPLNVRGHQCRDENMPHTCVGPDFDPNCPLNDPEYAERKKAERDALVRKYVAQDVAMAGLKVAASTGLHAVASGSAI